MFNSNLIHKKKKSSINEDNLSTPEEIKTNLVNKKKHKTSMVQKMQYRKVKKKKKIPKFRIGNQGGQLSLASVGKKDI